MGNAWKFKLSSSPIAIEWRFFELSEVKRASSPSTSCLGTFLCLFDTTFTCLSPFRVAICSTLEMGVSLVALSLTMTIGMNLVRSWRFLSCSSLGFSTGLLSTVDSTHFSTGFLAGLAYLWALRETERKNYKSGFITLSLDEEKMEGWSARPLSIVLRLIYPISSWNFDCWTKVSATQKPPERALGGWNEYLGCGMFCYIDRVNFARGDTALLWMQETHDSGSSTFTEVVVICCIQNNELTTLAKNEKKCIVTGQVIMIDDWGFVFPLLRLWKWLNAIC